MDIKAQLELQAMYSAQAAEHQGTPAPASVAEGTVSSDELPTRAAIAAMKRDDVVEWLKAHGVEEPKGKIDDLRAHLIAVMFIEA